MQSVVLGEKYPIQVFELKKSESEYNSCNEIIATIKDKIDKHPVAVYIATFDHYSHTKSLPEHKMDPNINDVKNIIFCFGKELPKPELASVRPRSIAVVEEDDRFVISFMDAPNPVAHEAMIEWVKSLKAS